MEAFEGSKDVLKTLREKAQKVGKIVLAGAKKAAGIHVGQVTEANPVYFIVVAPHGAMVRAGVELDSQPVHGLQRGDLVTCVDLSGRRARIIDPVEGWVSVKTQSNEPILEVTIAPDRETQISQMERRFAKLKAEKERSISDHSSETGFPLPSDQVIMESEGSPASLTAIKSKLTFKNQNDTLPSASTTTSSIPRLNGPAIKTSKPEKINEDSLLVLDSPKKSNIVSLPPQESCHSNPSLDPFAALIRSTIESSNTALVNPPVHPIALPPTLSVSLFDSKTSVQNAATITPSFNSASAVSDSGKGQIIGALNAEPPKTGNVKPGNEFDDWFK